MKAAIVAAVLAAFLSPSASYADARDARIHAVLPIDPLGLNGRSAPVEPVGPMAKSLKDVAINADVIIADLQAADSVAGAINPQTNKPYDALGHMCFPAAIALIQNLPNPAHFPAPSAGHAGLITGAENVYLAGQAAMAAINALVTSGLPQDFKIACAPWALDNFNQAANAAAMFTGFFAALVPK